MIQPTSEHKTQHDAHITRGLARLRELGCKLTPQRRAMLALFASREGHWTPQDVLDQLATLEPGLSRATVYNNLDLFAQAGLVQRVQAESGQTYFDPNLTPHHHAVCTGCQHIIDVTLPESVTQAMVAAMMQAMPPGQAFAVDGVTLWVNGVCEACRRDA